MESGLQWLKKGHKISNELQLMGPAGETLAQSGPREVCVGPSVSWCEGWGWWVWVGVVKEGVRGDVIPTLGWSASKCVLLPVPWNIRKTESGVYFSSWGSKQVEPALSSVAWSWKPDWSNVGMNSDSWRNNGQTYKKLELVGCASSVEGSTYYTAWALNT